MVYQVVSFLQLYPPQLCTRSSSTPHVPLAPPTSSSLISSPDYLMSSTNQEVPNVHCSLISSSFCPLRPKYLPQYPILTHPQATSFLQRERPGFTPIQHKKQKCAPGFVILCILDRDWENNRFWTKWYQAFTKFKMLLISSCMHASYRHNLQLGFVTRGRKLKGGQKVRCTEV